MRKELIERMRDATEGPRMLINEAADMLEAEGTETNFGTMPAVPQEPVAILNHAHGVHAIRSVNIAGLPDGEYKLFAAPQQQPRLTDEEILTLWAQTYVERGTSGIEFARMIEAAVMKNERLHTRKIFNPEGNNHEH